MSMQSQRIRDKFRQEIRARQIQQFKKIQRAKAIRQCYQSNIFSQLNQKIQENIKLPTSMKIIEELTSMMEAHPKNQNSYILISNYIIDHNDACKYVEVRVLSMAGLARELDNYKRVLLIMLAKSQQIQVNILSEYDLALAQIIQWSNSERQLSDCFNILQIILSLKNLAKDKKYLPENCIRQFFHKISQLKLKNLQADTKYHIIQTIYQLGIDHLENHMMKNYVPEIVRVIVLGIAEYCKFRSDFICILQSISFEYLEQFEQIFRTELGEILFEQLVYTYAHLPRERAPLLSIFKTMIAQFSFQLIIKLLNLQIHTIMISCLKDLNPDDLRDCLKTVVLLFNKLRQKQQIDLLYRVQDSMQSQNFESNLSDLLKQRQDPSVEQVLLELVDDFYSQEIN